MCVKKEDAKIGVYEMLDGGLIFERDFWRVDEYKSAVSRYVFDFDCER